MDCGCFAGTVRADKTGNAAVFDVYADVIDSCFLTKPAGQMFKLNHIYSFLSGILPSAGRLQRLSVSMDSARILDSTGHCSFTLQTGRPYI